MIRDYLMAAWRSLWNGVGLRRWLKDWRRGWDERDLLSAQAKLRAGSKEPGAWIEMTHREMAALAALEGK